VSTADLGRLSLDRGFGAGDTSGAIGACHLGLATLAVVLIRRAIFVVWVLVHEVHRRLVGGRGSRRTA
jgi:hypothetical protein